MKALILLFLTVTIFGGGYWATYELFYRKRVEMREDKLQPPPPPLPDPSLPEFEQCLALENTAPPLETRTAWRTFLEHNPHSSKAQEAKERLGRLNVSLFLSPIETPEKTV